MDPVLHPLLVSAITTVLQQMRCMGHPMRVTDRVRTIAQQQALYAKGRTVPGRIVTQADGIRSKSNHQAQADGYGHAVDCTFIDDQGTPRWLDSDPWALYGVLIEYQRLVWGGRWSHPDRPHAELHTVL